MNPLSRALTLVFCLTLTFAWRANAAATADPAVETSITRGVVFLIGTQQADGSFGQDKRHSSAMTSLSLLALACAGHQPIDRTPQGEAFQKGLKFILDPERVDANGYFGGKDGSRMYGHGITTLMLSEMLGMGTSPE